MSEKEYSLIFTQLSKCSLSLVVDYKAKMKKFVIWVSDMVVNVCLLEILVPNINILHLMVFVK